MSYQNSLLQIIRVTLLTLFLVGCGASTDTWTTAPDMPTGRFGLRTSVVGGKIYVIGGMDKWVGSAYRAVVEYEP